MAQSNDNDKTRTHIVLTKGTMVDHYRIIKKIGAGGMGEVYLAEDTKLDRQVALKFLPPHLCQDEDCRARFKREAQAAAKLDHPNIVTIHEVSEYQGRPFFAMQHVEGQSLRDHAKARELDIEQVVNLAIQLCDGLGAAHDKKVIHRDIKPSNIVIDAYGRPKILDFGLAAVQGGEHLTKTGSTLGTVRYMSPEQVKGKEVDHRSDLFSLGVVLYELIGGQSPFSRDNDMATGQAIVSDTPEPLTRYRANLPEPLQAIVAKLLEKDPNLRYQSAAGVIPDLRQLRRRSDSDATATMPIHGKRRNLMRLLVPTALAIIIALVLILKPWRFEISPSQEAIAAENRLAIMYFDNLVDPEDSQKLGEIATNLLITDLTESQYLDVVSSQRLYDILKLLGHEGEKKIDPDMATEVATKARAKWMLQGSILQVEPQLIITSQLVDVESGSAIASQRVSGEAGDNIFTLVDKLTVEVKSDLALPAVAQEEADRPVADVTTHSPEAYRYYLEGVDYGEKYYWEEALNSFREALKFDSTFAMAHFWVARYTQSEEERRRAIAKALEYSDRVTEKERWYIEAGDAGQSGQTEESIRRLERVTEHYPEEKLALLWLGITYANAFQFDEAIRCLKRIIEIDPLYKLAYNDLAYIYQGIGDYEQALWAINRYIELAPDEANPYDTRGEIYATNGQLDKAIESFQKALEIKPDFYISARSLGDIYVLRGDYSKAESYYHVRASHVDATQRGWGRLDLVRILEHQGKFQEALRRLDVGIETDRIELGDSWPAVNKIQRKAWIDLWFLEDYPAALEEAERHKRAVDVIDPGNSFWALWYKGFTAVAHARNGNLAGANSLMARLKQEIDTTEARDFANTYLWWLARAEFEKGNFDSAVALCEQVYQRDQSSHRMRFLGLYYLRADRVGDAVDMLERCLHKYDAGNLRWPAFYVITHYYLGQAYERSGWTDRAIEQYETFLDIWQNADEGLTSVEDTRTRLARLKGES